jgi:CspA family cold shock protein
MSTSTDKATSERFTGRVKWFNNKAGYGFITVTDGSRSGSDIFVHHSVIGVGSQQFRYLVQGEYVEFDLVPTTKGSTHEIQASNVCGIKGGKLMCETRNEYKSVAKTSDPVKSTSTSSSAVKMPRQKSLTSDKEWTKVGRKPQSKK